MQQSPSHFPALQPGRLELTVGARLVEAGSVFGKKWEESAVAHLRRPPGQVVFVRFSPQQKGKLTVGFTAAFLPVFLFFLIFVLPLKGPLNSLQLEDRLSCL